MERGSVRGRRGLRGLLGLVIGASVLSTAIVGLVAAFGPQPPAGMLGPLRVEAVDYVAEPFGAIRVTTTLAGALVSPTTVILQYTSYFASVQAGSVAMAPIGNRMYEATTSGFLDGTEVWFAVAASRPRTDPAISETFVVDVGTVPRGLASGLRIQDVQHSPVSPPPGGPVTVEATVVSSAAITEVGVAYMAFCADRTPVSIDPPMIPIAPSHYTIQLEPPGQCGFSFGTTILYRVIAMDATGNTAVSDVGTIRIQ